MRQDVDDRRPAAAGHRPRPVRRRRVGRAVVLLFVAGVLLPVALLAVMWPLTPSVGDAERRIAVRLAAHGGRDPGILPRPDKVGLALIATEDSRFYSHHGLDAFGVVRAAAAAATGSRTDFGGATLDQQLCKNLYTSNSLAAKVEQVVLSFKLEAHYSKQQILEMYLAEVYYGHGFYGLSAASRGYFGVAPADLNWAQASVLAGLVQAPSAYDPYQHLARAKARQRHVLDRLVATKTLTIEQADASFAMALHLQ
jgi:membrane carboxypeptidase/penicillin-binding protein